MPVERWAIDLAYEPDNVTGRMTMYTRFGAFCSDIASFDAGAMRIPQSEAAVMDPQQRLLLQAAAEAMADAQGCTGKPVGTFTGRLLLQTGKQQPAAMCAPIRLACPELSCKMWLSCKCPHTDQA